MAFCKECGKEVNEKAAVCTKCGVSTGFKSDNNGGKEWLTVLLLTLFLGPLGVHRFYTGHTGIGVVQLLTFGCCGIWTLIDLVLIITGKFKDSEGNLIKN